MQNLQTKKYYIVLNYVSIIFLLVIVYCCYMSIYRFITVYFLRQPLVVLLAFFSRYLRLHAYRFFAIGG